MPWMVALRSINGLEKDAMLKKGCVARQVSDWQAKAWIPLRGQRWTFTNFPFNHWYAEHTLWDLNSGRNYRSAGAKVNELESNCWIQGRMV